MGLAAMGIVVSLGAEGCGADRTEHPDPAHAFERLRADAPEDPLASVDGESVGREEFQRFWDNRPEREAASVVDGVVDREVAVQRAVDAGDHREPSLARTRKRAMVRSLLRREIEEPLGPSNLEESELEGIERAIRADLGRPAGIRASHLVIIPGERKSDTSSGPIGTESDREEAREWATRIRNELPDGASVTELFDARRRVLDEVPGGFRVVVDPHLRFPSPDSRNFRGSLPESWLSVVDAFAEGAHRMLEEGRGGRISEPIESKYGWHLIHPEERIPAKVPDPEATREVAVSQRLRERRRERFEERWEKWESRVSLAIDPQAVE